MHGSCRNWRVLGLLPPTSRNRSLHSSFYLSYNCHPRENSDFSTLVNSGQVQQHTILFLNHSSRPIGQILFCQSNSLEGRKSRLLEECRSCQRHIPLAYFQFLNACTSSLWELASLVFKCSFLRTACLENAYWLNQDTQPSELPCSAHFSPFYLFF